MLEHNNNEFAIKSLSSLHASTKPLKVASELPMQSPGNLSEKTLASEARAVLEMCPEVTADEIRGCITTGRYSMDGKTMHHHRFIPNPLAGLLQGFYLWKQPAWHDLVDQNHGVIAKIQSKVQTGIVRGKNNSFYLRPTHNLVRRKFIGETMKGSYRFKVRQAPSEFEDYKGTENLTRANLGFFLRAQSIWNKLGFPGQTDYRPEIFYFHSNPLASTTDFGMYLPKNLGEDLGEDLLDRPLDEVQRQLLLYQESEGNSYDPKSLQVVAYNKVEDYGRLLAHGDGFDVLHVMLRGLDRASRDRVTIVMGTLPERERDWLKKLVEHSGFGFPDLIAASLLYYGTPTKPLPWLPPGIKAIDPEHTSATHLNSIHIYFPEDKRTAHEVLFDESDVFTTLGKLDRGRYWEGKSGFASEVYTSFGDYLHQLGIYDEVKRRAVDPVLEAIQSSLTE